MATVEDVALRVLYEQDETAWLDAMAALAAGGRYLDLDYPNLAEYLADMARRDRRDVESRLIVLLAHILKWVHQPEQRSRSWRATVVEQRQELESLLERGVLRGHAEAVMADVYLKAIERVAAETGLPIDTFPATCGYSLDELLSPDVLNEEA